NGAEDISQIAPNLALIGYASQSSRSGKDAQQGNFGQTHGRRPVIDQHDLVARKRELVPAACSCAIARRQELDAGVPAGIFNPISRFVSEFAEVHLPRMRGAAKHVNVCAGAEDALLGAGQDYSANLGMLEADALQSVVQLNVDPKL